MRLDYQSYEQDSKLNEYVKQEKQEEKLLLPESKGGWLNKMSAARAAVKYQQSETRLSKESNLRNDLSQDLKKNSISKLHLLSNDQYQINKQSSSSTRSECSLQSGSQRSSAFKSVEKGKLENGVDVQNRVGSLNSSPKWARIKDKFERGDLSQKLDSPSQPQGNTDLTLKVLSKTSGVGIKTGSLQRKPLENRVTTLQPRTSNISASARLKCSSLPYKLVNGTDRLQERTKMPSVLRTNTKYNSVENCNPKLENPSDHEKQSLISRHQKTVTNVKEDTTKQRARIPLRTVDCKKNEIFEGRVKKMHQDVKVKPSDSHPVPTSRTSLIKPKTHQVYSNISLHPAGISRSLQYTHKGKLPTKEKSTSDETVTVDEKIADIRSKLQKCRDILQNQKTRSVSDSGQESNLRIPDCDVTESRVAYLTNKFNFLSCQSSEMKKSCSAVNVDEASKYVLSKSFSASNVFSTSLHRNESCCQKSSQKQISLTCNIDFLPECLPANDASCAVMGKCSCLGLFSKHIDHHEKKIESDHVCRSDNKICTQPVSNKSNQIQELGSADDEKLNVVQKAVLSYENLVLLSPETQRKNYVCRLKDSSVMGNGVNVDMSKKIETNSRIADQGHSEKGFLREEDIKQVSNKETVRSHSFSIQNSNDNKETKETSVVTKNGERNSQANTASSHMLSKGPRSLTLDSIRSTSSFLHSFSTDRMNSVVDAEHREKQLEERYYVNQDEIKVQVSLQPNSSFLWNFSAPVYQKVDADANLYENNSTILGRNIIGQSSLQTRLRKQSICSKSSGNSGSCDSDDQGSWIDVSDAEVDSVEKRSSNSSAASTLKRNKGRKDTQKRNSVRKSWSDSVRAIADVPDSNDDEYQDVSFWETVDGEINSTEMENQYEPLYECIYQHLDDRSNLARSPDDSSKHHSDTSSEMYENDDDILSMSSEKSAVSTDDKKKSVKRQWSLGRNDIKSEFTSKLNKIISSKRNLQNTYEVSGKSKGKTTEAKRSTLMRYICGPKSNTTGPASGSCMKKELSTFYVDCEDTLQSERESVSSGRSADSKCTDEKAHPTPTSDPHKKLQTEIMLKYSLRRNTIQRPTAPPPLPPDPIAKCRGGTKSMEFTNTKILKFSKTRSLDSTCYKNFNEGIISLSEISIQEGSLPNKNSLGEISSISTSEEMIASSSSSDRTENGSSSSSKGSRYSENCYSLISSATDSSADRDNSSVFSSSGERQTSSGFCQTQEDNSTSENSTLVDNGKCKNKSEILKSPFEEEPLYQFYIKDVRTRATIQQRMNSDDDQSETESLYANVNDEYTDGPLVLKSQLSAMELAKTGDMGQRTLWCHVPEVEKSGILATLCPQDRSFQEAMFEVITSEASYLKSMNVLVEHFIQCPEFSDEFSTRCVLSRRDKHILFSDVFPVKEVSERLLADLESHWKENIMMSRVCEILHKHASENFSVYVRYCSNQIYQDRTLKMLKETKPEFTEVLNRLESSPVCQSLDMHSFLMLPMQRITRLPLLVDAMFHRLTVDSPQYEICKATLALLNKIVQDCNEGTRKMERMEEMLSIERQLDFKDCKGIPLISTSRWLVKKGEVTRFICDTSSKRTISFSTRWSKVPVYLFLFTDYLVVTKKKSEEHFTVLDYCPRNMVQVAILDNDNRVPLKLPSSGKFIFLLTMLSNHKNKAVELVLGVSLESERTRWMDAVTPPVSDNPDERIYEVWDCPQVQCIYSYTAQQPDELSLEESDVVNVFRKVSDGWYEGERIRDGVRGWFPASYTEEIVSSHVRARNLRQHYRLLVSLEKKRSCQGK